MTETLKAMDDAAVGDVDRWTSSRGSPDVRKGRADREEEEQGEDDLDGTQIG